MALFPGDDEPTTYEPTTTVSYGCAAWCSGLEVRAQCDQGDVTRRTDPDGHITDYSYNRYGQLVGVWHPDQEVAIGAGVE